MNKSENKKRSIIVHLLIAVIISVVLSHTVFSELFISGSVDGTIRIEATAKKNILALGTDIRVASVAVDGQEIPLDELECSGPWEQRDGVILIVNPQEPGYLQYHVESAGELEVVFQKHEGSGIAKIEVNGKSVARTDLYSKEWDSVACTRKLGKVSIFQHKAVFILLTVFFWMSISLPKYLIGYLKEDRKKRIAIVTAALALAAACMLSGGIADKIAFAGSLLIVWFVLILSVPFHCLEQCEKYGENLKSTVSFIVSGILSSVYVYIVIELVNGNNNWNLDYAVGNTLVYLAIYLLIYFMGRSVTIAAVGQVLVCYLFAVANFYVKLFRGTPIVPEDLLAAGTAKNVFLNYKYTLPNEIIVGVLLLAAYLIVLGGFYGLRRRKKKAVLAGTLPASIIVALIAADAFFAQSLDLWNLNNNVQKYGLALSFISNVRRSVIQQPEGYSKSDVESHVDMFVENEEQTDSTEEFNPTVIAIMNETFSNLKEVDPELDDDVYLSYYKSLSDHVVKGKMYVSVLGGGTANTEYEFLTGNSISFLPGSLPYQQYVTKDGTYCITQILKARGYKTIAIHPYDGKGYNRYRVYPRFGFDEFLDINDFEDPELVRNLYTSDRCSYEKIIEKFEENQGSGNPAFIFNVTMQNHSGYETGYFGDDVLRVEGYEGQFPKVEEYLTLIKKSDEALSGLLDYFSNVDEPVVIVLFGDHQPAVEEEFYQAMNGKPSSEWSLEEVQQKYVTPFFIWANYDIEEKQNVVTSANYLSTLLFETAGMKEVPYQKFLSELHEKIPAININGYMKEDGKWYTSKADEPLLQQYWIWQYANMFDKKIHY